ncbi:MAG: SUMF1/EgtB/PvdO family nonheme iron enzyme [Planctomycetia bacterium]|nr:SUMF1/EgtB/PvdO family nonheme iron enzyme [Planctomycetia bacterium]
MKKVLFIIFIAGLFCFSSPDLYGQRNANRAVRPPQVSPAKTRKERSPFEEAMTADGKLDLSRLSKELPEQLIEKLKKSDEDKDGFLDFKERQKAFKLGMKPKEGAPGLAPRPNGPGRNLFLQAKRADGALDLSKIPRDIPVEEWNHLKKADLDGDGLLSKKEQEKAFQNRTYFPSPMIQQGPESRSEGKNRSHRKGSKEKPSLDPFQKARMEDGRIDLSKLPEDIPSHFLDQIKEADTNKDGYLDTEEQKELRAPGKPGAGPVGPDFPPPPVEPPPVQVNTAVSRVPGDRLIKAKGDVPNDQFVFIPANPEFRFKSNFRNDGEGEKAPITKTYCLAKYPVRNREYAQFLAETKYDSVPKYWKNGSFPKGKEDHPVVQISCKDAEVYCAWMNGKYPGWTFRIPTEAEWENAASGPDHLAYPWGDHSKAKWEENALSANFNYNGYCAAFVIRKERESAALLKIMSDGSVKGWITEDPKLSFLRTDDFKLIVQNGGTTTPVDRFKEGYSPYGCFDMAGNCSEWTSSKIDGSEEKTIYAVRGGSWFASLENCSCTFRGEGRSPENGYITVGFRIAAGK